VDDLKKQAEELGIKVDKRWSDQRLQAEIDEKLAETPEPAVEQPEIAPEAVELEPVVEPESVTDPIEPESEFSPEVKAAADAEIQDEIQARFDVAQEEGAVVVTNLQASPMKALGLASYGEVTFTQGDLARDPQLVKKLERAELLGLVKIEGK